MAKKTKPGWYPDPEKPGHEKRWDGENWTTDSRVAPPTSAKKRRGGSTFLKVLLGVVVGGVLLIGGCVAIIGAGLNAEEEDGITRQQFTSISLGSTQASIVSEYGEPDNSQDFESQIPELQDQPSRSSCIYYPEKGKKILEGASFQLCFDDGKLTAKNAY